MGSDGARPGGAAPRARRSARFAHVALTLGLAATASAQDAPRILDLVGRARSGDVAARAELAGVFRDAAPPLDRARLHALGEAAIELAATGDGAVEILERARELLEGAGLPESEVNVARQLGHEWMRRGEPDKAIAEWRRGSRLPARALRPWLLVELAAALRGRGEWAGAEEAIADAEKALVPGDAFHHMARAAVFGERGQQELDLGVANLAFRSFLEERRVADEIGEPVLRLAARLHEIHYALAVEDGAEATRLASEALADPALVASAPGTAA
ncbi:MAG TPA: hypothetical protein VKE69_11915, partial [Planctomycetota bacterium]|nr:hypothetical protein [Planctomycetota bacterium]